MNLISDIHAELDQALAEEHQLNGLTKADLARRLGVHKSALTRRLSGLANMTLATLADLAWALDRPPSFQLPRKNARIGQNAGSIQTAFDAPSKAAMGSESQRQLSLDLVEA